MSQLPFFLAVALFVTALTVIAGYSILRARRASRSDWNSIIGRLKYIDRDTFARSRP